jgi:parallel beta-helix repeat protein
MARRLLVLLLAVAAVLAVALRDGGPDGEALRPERATPTVRCDRVAAPHGDDAAAGTLRAPWRTAARLVRGLRKGQTGCLRRGTYRGDVTLATPGITLRVRPGERARVAGRLWVRRGADGVQVVGLILDGRNARDLPSPTVNADRAEFRSDEVTTQHHGICFLLGSPGWGRARGTVIRESRIHACGRLPRTNREHGIYVAQADDTKILDNVIYDNADRGIQLYPDAHGTVVQGNIIDNNGEGVIFSGAGEETSRDNVVRGNVISRPRVRSAVESWYPDGTPHGVGNRVTGNCLYAGGRPPIDSTGGGFVATENVVADPRYRDADRGDYRLAAQSQCAAILAGSRAPAGPTGLPPVTEARG